MTFLRVGRVVTERDRPCEGGDPQPDEQPRRRGDGLSGREPLRVDERDDAGDGGDDGDLDVEANEPPIGPAPSSGDRPGVGEDERGDGQQREGDDELGGDEGGVHGLVGGRAVREERRRREQSAGEHQHRDADGAGDERDRPAPLTDVAAPRRERSQAGQERHE